MALKGAQTAVGADIIGPLQIFGQTIVGEGASGHALVHVQPPLDALPQGLFAHGGGILRLDDLGHPCPHLALAHHIAPAGMDAVAALDAQKGDGQFELLRHLHDGGVHVLGLSRIGPVAFGSQRQRAALLDDLQAVAHRPGVGGLFFDGDGVHRPFEQHRHPALVEQVFGGQIVHRAPEGHAEKELVKGRLVVHQHQILPVALLFEGLHPDAVFPAAVGVQHQPRQRRDDPVAGLDPCFLFLHRKILFSHYYIKYFNGFQHI